MDAPRKTEQARQLLSHKQRQLSPALRALLITVDGKRSTAELQQLARGLGLDEQALSGLIAQGLVEQPHRAALHATLAQAKRLVSAKFFALDLVTRMLAGREGPLRDAAREADTESRFMAWVELCCQRISEQADQERAALFRARVEAALGPLA